MSDAIYDSSGVFTLQSQRHRSLLGDHSLSEPALAVLWLVQGAVAAGVAEIRLRLSTGQLDLVVRGGTPLDPPPPLWERLWHSWGHPYTSQRGDLRLFRWARKIPPKQLQQETELVRKRGRFCPVPLKLGGYIVQPHLHSYDPPGKRSGVPRHYHLAEWYLEGSGPGLSVFRPAGSSSWRSRAEGTEELRWSMPWRVAGQVARLRPARGIRAGTVALLLVQPQRPSRVVAVSQGVVVGEHPLNWPELPGLELIVDTSQLPLDLSHLQLVNGEAWQLLLQQQRQRLGQWVARHIGRWQMRDRSHSVLAEQNKKEAAAWLSVWGASLVTGAGIYLPLPLLALPWILWHHRSRRSMARLWARRLTELSSETSPQTP